MNALPDLARLSLLHDRLQRMLDSGHDLAHASGLDEVLPILDTLLKLQPQLYDLAEDLRLVGYVMGKIHKVLRSAGHDKVPARPLFDLLDISNRRLLQQNAQLQALVYTGRVAA